MVVVVAVEVVRVEFRKENESVVVVVVVGLPISGDGVKEKEVSEVGWVAKVEEDVCCVL